MNSLERVNSAIGHKQPDRVPIDLRFAPEMVTRLLSELKMDKGSFWEWLGQDVYTVRPTYKNPASPVKYADPTIEVTSQGFYLDIYRVPFRKIENDFQTYIEPVDMPPLASINSLDELARFPWPKVDAWDYSRIESEIESRHNKAVWPRSRGCFQSAQLMRGMEKFLIDLATDPDYACSLMDYILDFVIEDARCSLEAGKGKYTFIEYNDDVGSQKGLLISPDMWRKYVKPRMKKFCDMAHGLGTKVKYHSCGSIYAIIPDLIEIGVNILNPIQPLAAKMDPFQLKKEFGAELCFHGGVDIQNLLPNGSAQEVRDTVKRLITQVGEDGGYILAGSHTIQTDAKIENIVAMVQTALES